MPRSYTKRELKILFSDSGGVCAHPDCTRSIVIRDDSGEQVVVGQIAHIVAHGDHGPRADPSMPQAARDSLDNVLLLCGEHHPLVDTLPHLYPTETLRAWKAEHEAWVARQLGRDLRRVSFAELALIVRALATGAVEPDTDYRVIDPARKLALNGLGPRSRWRIAQGLVHTAQVAGYLAHQSTLDPDLPGRLKTRFVAEYRALVEAGERGDALFAKLVDFAQRGRKAPDLQAAALTVVCYLFETCEVFES